MWDLYKTIWRVSGRRQIVLIVLSVAIAALAAAPLKFQQEIINLLGEDGAARNDLFLLGAGMIGVILLSLSLKWLMGYRSGLLGEDMIRLIRNRLVEASAAQESRENQTAAGTLSTAISAEAEELGKFAGSAFSDPVMQMGTLISVVSFVAATQPGLGLLAAMIVLPQVLIVLFTQKRINALVAERVHILRAANNRLSNAEIAAIRASVLADFDRIYEVRRSMFRWKLSTKFLVSAVNGAGTVAVLMLGGALVLRGQTDVGTVVAATLGLSRLQGPTTFLIAFYRQVSANRVKFDLLRDLSGVR